jgi:hypothetical protein
MLFRWEEPVLALGALLLLVPGFGLSLSPVMPCDIAFRGWTDPAFHFGLLDKISGI